MSAMKRMMDEVAENANIAFMDFVTNGTKAENPYHGQFGEFWNDTYNKLLDELNNWYDELSDQYFAQLEAEHWG